ncbi:MAG: hypothetical protein CMP22_06885 [Rickettsiales bacterium]|nr:hypothetical protein [Rickettsiales bacterium]|tara:strand:+ start:1223 stop:1534 length:312 start_codon:yes stop_codon:yes gene_type:complete
MKKFKNAILMTTLLIGLSLTSNMAFANTPSQALVTVNGLVCDFCARALDKVFTKQEAVEDIDVNLDTKLITIDFKPEQSLEEEKIKELITDSGYDVVDVEFKE